MILKNTTSGFENTYMGYQEGFIKKLLSVFNKPKAEVSENLEIHFWDWEAYSYSKMLRVFKLISQSARYFKIKYVEIDPNDETCTDSSFEDRLYGDGVVSLTAESSDFWHISELIRGNVVNFIEFRATESWLANLRMTYSEGWTYYSIEIPIIQEKSSEEVFEDVLNFYRDLLSIFQPVVSNAGSEILWLDAKRLESERSFEGIFGYLANGLDFDFIPMKRRIQTENGMIFLIAQKMGK